MFSNAQMGSGSFNEVKPITDFLATFGQPNPERFNDRASVGADVGTPTRARKDRQLTLSFFALLNVGRE